jgi:N-methylhydantoinase A
VAEVAAAIEARIGRRLGLDAVGAAPAILRVANDRMAGAIRMVSLGRGHDPRDVCLLAFGGAGPLHATALARELGIPRVLVPVRPGLTNAIGCVVADLRHDYTRTVNQPLETVAAAGVGAILAEQAAAGRAVIEREGIPVEGLVVLHSADMQFRGQTHLLNVAVAAGGLSATALRSAFERAYAARFGIELPEIGAMLVNLKTSVIGRRGGVDIAALVDAGEAQGGVEAARVGERDVWLDGGWATVPVLERGRLRAGTSFAGPAILQQMDTTVVVESGWAASVDAVGNLILTG